MYLSDDEIFESLLNSRPIDCTNKGNQMNSSRLRPPVACLVMLLLTTIFAGCDSAKVDVPEPVADTVGTVAQEETEETPEKQLEKNAADQEDVQEQGATEGVKKWLGERLKQAADTSNDAAQAAGDTAEGSVEWATETYEQLKEQGLTTANSAGQWFTEDFKSMGAWEYKIVELNLTQSSEQAEQQLNALGRERWECFQVTPQKKGSSHYYFFKRPKRSYLKNIPLKDVLKLVPLMNNE